MCSLDFDGGANIRGPKAGYHARCTPPFVVPEFREEIRFRKNAEGNEEEDWEAATTKPGYDFNGPVFAVSMVAAMVSFSSGNYLLLGGWFRTDVDPSFPGERNLGISHGDLSKANAGIRLAQSWSCCFRIPGSWCAKAPINFATTH